MTASTRRRPAVIGWIAVVAIASVCAALLVWRWNSRAPSDAVEPLPAAIGSSSRAQGSQAARQATNAPLPLPASNAPLREVFAELKAGDALAARRLCRDTADCRLERLRAQTGATSPAPAIPPEGATTQTRADLDAWRANELRSCVRQAMCAGLTLEQVADPDQWLLRAAETGDRRAQVEFASGQTLITPQSLDSYNHVSRWQQVALPWLEQAVAEGEPAALNLVGGALSADREASSLDLLGEILADDPQRGYSLLLALSLAPGLGRDDALQRRLAAAAARLDVQQRLAAQRIGRDLYRRFRRHLDQAAAADLRLRSCGQASAPSELQAAAATPACRAQIEARLQAAQEAS